MLKLIPSVFCAVFVFGASVAFSDTATVDGIGGVATSDPTFPLTYLNVKNALTDANVAAGNHIINITTVGPLDEPTGLAINQDKSLTINGAPGGTHLRINATGVGASGASVGIGISVFDSRTINLNRLIITPSTGAAGIVSARGLQIFSSTNTTINATVNLTDVMITSVRPIGHGSAGQPLRDPFFQYEDTLANRRANMRSFNGGGTTSVYDISSLNSNAASLLTVNMVRSGACNIVHNAAAAFGGGLVQLRSSGLALNILDGCYFTFCDIAGIRTTAFIASGNASLKIAGTTTNPVIIYRNGWLEDTANTGRNEGILLQVGSSGSPQSATTLIDHTIIAQNYQEGIDVTGGTTLQITNSIIAENQYDLDPATGTQPSIASAANLLVQTANVTVDDSTLFDNKGNPVNDNAIRYNAAAATSLATNRTIIAGAGDQIAFATGTRTWTDADTAVVTAGPDAMDASPVVLNGNTRTSTFPLSADPDFESTTFTPTFTYGVGNSVPSSYMSVRSPAYLAARAVGASDVKGGNQGSPLPISLSGFSLE